MNIVGNLKATVVIAMMLAAGTALAHTGATGIVKERMDIMGILGDAQKTLKAMFQGKAAYDPDKVRAAALVIQKHAGEQMTKLFPEDSLKKPSEALPVVWEDWAGFQKLAEDLAIYARALHDAADNHDGTGGNTSSLTEASDLMGAQDLMSGGDEASGQQEDASVVAEKLRTMPAQQSFLRVVQTCTDCHTKFRKKKH